MEKYDWLPSECSPLKYPMEILKGSFIFEDGNSVYIPDGRIINNGWGELGSTHLVGDTLKPIPERLSITWFSFTEAKFYSGNWVLPQDKISSLFREGYISPLSRERLTFDTILVGLAPGGGVVLWVMGEQVVKEVCILYASESDIEWKSFIDNPEYNKRDYIQLILSEAFGGEALFSKEVPYGMWDKKYRIGYDWEPLIISKAVIRNISIGFYNGEREYLDLLTEHETRVEKRAVPKVIGIKWETSLGNRYYSKVSFDEHEVFLAFDKMFSEEDPRRIYLQIEVSEVDYNLRLFLRNNKYILEVKKCEIKVYES